MSQQIVTCDDETHIVRAIQLKLSLAGFNVRTGRDGQEAWELIQKSPPDLLITDYQMPRLDGLSLCRQLRRNPLTHDLPIILLTAKGFELDWDDLKRELGLARVMIKPFSPRELLLTVQQVLQSIGQPVGV